MERKELREHSNFFHPDSTATDPTKFSIDYRKDYLLAQDEWKFDAIPEIVDGKNVADYVDPEIDARLAELEVRSSRPLALSLSLSLSLCICFVSSPTNISRLG